MKSTMCFFNLDMQKTKTDNDEKLFAVKVPFRKATNPNESYEMNISLINTRAIPTPS